MSASSPRKIAVVTGGRAEYGLLYWLLREIEVDSSLELQLLVTGMHLSAEFGLTYQQIEQDGFTIAAKVDMLLSGDTPTAIAKSMGLTTIGCADALAQLQPDMLVVLGDRFEIFAAAQAALVANIPIVHLHGGEVTEGAVDEAFRHGLTKMAHVHCVAAEAYRQRVIQLGEQPSRVFTVGALGLDNLQKLSLLSQAALADALDFPLRERFLLVTYHPVTLQPDHLAADVDALLTALDAFPDYQLLCTKTNADSGGRYINQRLATYAAAQPERVLLVTSLGQLRYLSALALAQAVVGNSSSGILEAPTAATATVNIGIRQQGRLRATSVVDCDADASAIIDALARVLSTEFQAGLASVDSPYGQGGVAARIVAVLKELNLEGILVKRFYDLVD